MSRLEKDNILKHSPFPAQFAFILTAIALHGCDFEARRARRELGDEIPAVRAAAVEKLGRTKRESAIPEIGPLINDRSPIVRLAVVKELRKLKSSKGLHFLQTGARDADPEVRLAAVRGLGELKNKRAVPTLLARLDDGNPVVRRAAGYALIDIGIDRPGQVALLAERARNRWISLAAANRAVATRIEAIRELSLSGKKDVVSILLPMLKENDVEIVEAAAAGLGILGGEKARKAIRAGLLDESPQFKQAMEKGAIKLLHNHPPGEWTLDFIHSDVTAIRRGAIAQLLRHSTGLKKTAEQEDAKQDHPGIQKADQDSDSKEEFFSRLKRNPDQSQKICCLLEDPQFEIAYDAGLLARNLRLDCKKPTPEEEAHPEMAIRSIWLKALVKGSITSAEEEKISAWCSDHPLPRPLAEIFAKLNLPKVHHAVKEQAERLYKQYLQASKRWLDEDQWRSLEQHGRAKTPGPKISAPSDPKTEQIKDLLSRFPDHPGERIVFFPPEVDSKDVKEVLNYLGFYKGSRTFLARIVLEGPQELHSAALTGMGARDFREPPFAEIVDAIKKAVTGPPDVRKAAATALGAMGEYGLHILVQLLKNDPDADVRAAAASGMARTGVTAARKPLRKSLEKTLSLAKIKALEKLQDPLSVPILLKHLKRNPPDVLLEERAAVIQALGTLGKPDKELLAALVDELDHPFWQIRMTAAESLGLLGAKESIPPLKARSADFYDPVRRSCKQAIATLEEQF